ncbi:DUF1385 domain-containing protein [Guptibacillus algicola]|uniref:DUF1385 domain-containing protein n=1 Tax=Guptibacillus algicola TaxID=225844 RepID=UPI001CD5C785|nr:DUF1385 domain-containing protein [Alkalihalobacillus algicola]MCA0985990.1 DUF1385 domain-containing protein [Alkalihalobacillus algicola]
MSDTKKPAYGGQAVVEGVMFQGKHTSVTAIRRKDDSIDYLEIPKKPKPIISKLKKIPFIRGVVAIIDASGNGTKHLNFSSERYDIDPSEDEEALKKEEPSKMTFLLGAAALGVISFAFVKTVFTLLPALAAASLEFIFPGHVIQNIIEGVIKLILLLGYIYFISLTPIVKRVFQYHGAEHKVINAYEAGLPITVENVQSQSRLHFRCGSSFILFTVVIGVFIYLMVPSDPLLVRLLYRVLLIPVVLGVSFEVLQLTNKFRNIPVLRGLGYPGLWVQLLTTKNPDDKQVEVAICSFKELLARDKKHEEESTSTQVV